MEGVVTRGCNATISSKLVRQFVVVVQQEKSLDDDKWKLKKA